LFGVLDNCSLLAALQRLLFFSYQILLVLATIPRLYLFSLFYIDCCFTDRDWEGWEWLDGRTGNEQALDWSMGSCTSNVGFWMLDMDDLASVTGSVVRDLDAESRWFFLRTRTSHSIMLLVAAPYIVLAFWCLAPCLEYYRANVRSSSAHNGSELPSRTAVKGCASFERVGYSLPLSDSPDSILTYWVSSMTFNEHVTLVSRVAFAAQ